MPGCNGNGGTLMIPTRRQLAVLQWRVIQSAFSSSDGHQITQSTKCTLHSSLYGDSVGGKKKQNTEPTLTKWEKYGNGTSTSVLKTNWWSFSESEWNESVYSEERWFRGGLEGVLIGHRSNDFWHLFYYKVSKLLSAELTNVLVTVVFEKHSEC